MKSVLLPWDVDLLPQKKLLAGELTCMYEAGNLRSIKCGGTEILRMIYSALRNENWDTIPFSIVDEKIEEKEKGFFISYTAVYQQDDISYKAFFEIEGGSDSTITFLMKGEALSSFKRNRIGLCAHHPIKECEGCAVEIRQTGNTVFNSVFPRLISPHQPFVNMEGMKWTTADNLQMELKFGGDIFETEDQRNWTDSSYKTYSTPLSLPFPVMVTKGEKILQRISLSVNTDKKVPAGIKKTGQEEKKIPFPKIGYRYNPEEINFTASDITQLQSIPLDQLRIELDLSNAGWSEQLQNSFDASKILNTVLELILFIETVADKQVEKFINQLSAIHQKVASLLVLQKGAESTPLHLIAGIHEKVKKDFPAIRVGYGTHSHFADLNRHRPPLNNSFDFISFSLHPRVHASDSRSIFENLQNQYDTIITAKTFAPGKPIHIYIKFDDQHKTENKADPGQYSWFAALWTLLTIQNLGEANRLSFYELNGNSGIIAGDGQLTPTYQVLAMIREFEPVWIIKRYNNGELLMDGLLLENIDGQRLFFESGKP